ncbi:hypothetical protein BD779DRAFT_1609359 [Infundibulicybe gibba]|nr:hypothetical protein BD779DRAFT_1609359 [Infundibulicybe gibba]
MTTTLPLFWHLSSASRRERIDASVKLIGTLEQFQVQFAKNTSSAIAGSEGDEDEVQKSGSDGLDALNAQDVSYSIRRLVRGLASPRESSRLGFAVALTELLSRIATVTCTQIATMIVEGTKSQGSMTGQEERDVLFARLFGLMAVTQSGLLVRAGVASGSIQASSLQGYDEVITELLALGEKKTWLRESAWWAVALALYAPSFKNPDILSTGNLHTIARILKESSTNDEEKDVRKAANGSWRPQLHFVWDMLLDQLLPGPNTPHTPTGNFQDFFQIVIDESLFSSTSSPERKYWGFQLANALYKNFMRSWINHLSHQDRYLHKIAMQTATELQAFIQQHPQLGFSLILQLTGVNGSQQFDKLTKTKTVETILTSMDETGIKSYIDYLLGQVNEPADSGTYDVQSINTRRAWIIDQLASLIRNGSIPKNDEWIQLILDWFVVHGLFTIQKKSSKSPYHALHSLPKPTFSDELRELCRSRLLGCLSNLSAQANAIKTDGKTVKASAVASDGEFWVSKVLNTIETLESDSKHVSLLAEPHKSDRKLHARAKKSASRLRGETEGPSKGAELLLLASILQQYCAEDQEDVTSETLENSDDDAVGEDSPEPVDVLVDSIIGFLEKSTAYMRTIGNQVFTLLSESVQASTIDLIVSRGRGGIRDDAEESSGDSDEDDAPSEGDSDNEDVDLELRAKIEEALKVNGMEVNSDSEEEEEELMDDEQMMAVDDQLAAVFRARANEKKTGNADVQREATHFKIRVLDLVDSFIKKQPSNPHVIRLIMPLIELVSETGPDEQQLSDKARGIIKTRIGKGKDVPTETDQVPALMTELHAKARKTHSPTLLPILSHCCVYLAKVMLHSRADDSLLQAYRESLVDFMTRKNSALNTGFFQDFMRRHQVAAWNLRGDVLRLSTQAVNVYRQCQAFQLLETLVATLPNLASVDPGEILEFMSTLRANLLEVLTSACRDKLALTTAQAKDLLKLALLAVRQTQRIISTVDPEAWTTLRKALESSERLKNSPALQKMCDQIVRSTQSENASQGSKKATKRKADKVAGSEEASPEAQKVKRKKVRKSKD